ncbi:MAG: GtrA family protein [Barnesiella sp.]|nr:GtrA family protein [Barnesiella sp.]
MKFLRRIYCKFRTLILYGIIGCLASGLDFTTFTVLVSTVGINYIPANCISVLIGIITSFILNRNYNFKIKDKSRQRFIIFLLVGLSGMLLSNLILWICISKLCINDLTAKLMSICIVVFFQFLVNKNVTFKPSNQHFKI